MKSTQTTKSTAPKREHVPYFSQESEHDTSMSAIQCKLTVGEVDDPYEKEADETADHVINAEKNGKDSNAGNGKNQLTSNTVQKKAIFESEEEPEVKPGIHRKPAGSGSATVQPSLQSRLSSQKGKGSSLPSHEQSAMGNAFGHDFKDVRIHTDPEASGMSNELHAQAFTHGSDIYFNEGKFDTKSEKGRHLLAHELTHTIQQQGEQSSVNRMPDIQKDETKKLNIKDMDDAALKALGSTKEGSISKENGKVAFHFKDFPTKQYVGPFVTKDSAGNESLAAPPFQKPNTERKTKQASVWRKEALPKVTAVLNNIIDKQQIKGPEYQLALVNSTGVGVRGTVEQIAKEIVVPFWGLDGKPIAFQIEHKVDWQIAGGNHDVDVISNLILLDAKSNIDVGQEILGRMKSYYSKIADYYSKTKNIEGIVDNLSESTASYDIFCDNLVGVSDSVPGSLLSISNFELTSGQTPFSDKLIKVTDGDIPEGKFILKTSQKGGGFLVSKDLDNSVMTIKFENNELKSITLKNVVKDDNGVLDSENPDKNLSFQKESKDRYKVKTEGYAGLMKSVFKGIKAMSPIEWSEVDFSPHTGFTASGVIKPTPKLLQGALLTIELAGGEFIITGTIAVDLLKQEGRFPKPFSLDYCSLSFSASSAKKFAVSGDVGFSLKNVGKGNVSAFVNEKPAFGMQGKFTFEESKKFKKAEIGFTYTKEKDDGKWEVTGDIVFGKELIKVVETGNVSISYDGKTITGKGSADLTIPKFKKLELSAAFQDSGNFEFKAKAKIEDLPGVKDVNATVIINRKDGAYALDITGTATPVFNKVPGLEIKPLTISYNNEVFKIEGGLGYKKGMIDGSLTLGVTNGVVDADGKVTGAGKDGSKLSIYGTGTAKITFLKGMDASISAALDPDGELWIWGKLSVKATPFEAVKKNFNIFSFAQTVPLVGVPFLAVILRFGGEANLVFDWQPLTINIETTLAKSKLDDLQKGKLGGGISLSLTSTANAKIELSVTIGIGVEVAIAAVSLNGKGTLGFGINVPLEAKTSGNWNLTKGLTIEEASASLKAIPEAYAKLTGLILVELNLLVSRVTVYTYELGSIEKKFDLSQYGLGVTVPLKFNDAGKLEGIDMKSITLDPAFGKGSEKDLLSQVGDSDSRPKPSREELARIALRKEIRSKLDAKRNSKASVDMYQYASDLRRQMQKATPELSNDINQILEEQFSDVEQIQFEDFRTEIMMAKDPVPVKLKRIDAFAFNHKTVRKSDIDILKEEIELQAPATTAPSSAQRKQMDVEGEVEEPKDTESKKSNLEKAQEENVVSKQPETKTNLPGNAVDSKSTDAKTKDNDAAKKTATPLPVKPEENIKTVTDKKEVANNPAAALSQVAETVEKPNATEQSKSDKTDKDKAQAPSTEKEAAEKKDDDKKNKGEDAAKQPQKEVTGQANAPTEKKGEATDGVAKETKPGEKAPEEGKQKQGDGKKEETDKKGGAENKKEGKDGKEGSEKKDGKEKDKKGKKEGDGAGEKEHAMPAPENGKMRQPDVAAQINNEFHAMPSLASLLQKPGTEEKAKDEPATSDVSVQRMPDKGGDSKDQQEELRESTIKSVTESGERALMNINDEVNAQQAEIAQNASAVKAEAMGNVQSAILETRNKFATAREQVNNVITSGELMLGADLAVKTALVIINGTETKTKITELFANERLQIDDAVNEGLLKTTNMRNQYSQQASTVIDGQVASAITRGEQKASTFPDTERGREQKSAARGVAKDTSKEIAIRKQEVIGAIDEVIAPIPDEFVKKGEEAKTGLDQPVTDLLTQTDAQVIQVTGQLNTINQQALAQLQSLRTAVNAELTSLEEDAVLKLQAMLPAIEMQVSVAVTTSIAAFEAARTAVSAQLNQKITEAQQLLKDTPSPDKAGMMAFGNAMNLFFSGTSTEIASLLAEAGLQMQEETGAIADQVNESISILLSGSDKALSQLQQTVAATVMGLFTQQMVLTETAQASLAAAFTDVTGQITSELAKTIDKLKQGFQKTLTDVEGKIQEKVTEGLSKNDEALAEMDGKMDEAASDAAWDYDHPILSAVGSVLSFIAGLVAGLLLILVLVVAFIVAIKLLIIGLVALGISLVVAEIIGAIVGLAFLAYGVYNAYQARTARGEGGGFGTFISSIGDVTGISSVYHGLTDEGLSAFDRGFKIGEGIGTIGSFFLGRKIDAAVSKGLPPGLANPGRVVNPFEGETGGGGGKGGGDWNVTPIEKAYEYRAARAAKSSQSPGGTRASAANDAPYTASDAYKLDPAVDPVVEPQPAPQPVPEPGTGTNPATEPYAGSTKVGVGGASASSGVRESIKSKTKKKEKDEEEEDQKSIYKFENNVVYDGRKGNFTYSKTHKGASYRKEGHHAWPKVLGGPADQPLVNMIYSIHQSEIHYGWSPAGSPFPAIYGTIYSFLDTQINSSPVYGDGKGGMNVLQGRRLTHTGGKNSGNQLLIDAMEAGTATAKRLARFVWSLLSTYYGEFAQYSDPAMPVSFYEKGLDKSFNDITS